MAIDPVRAALFARLESYAPLTALLSSPDAVFWRIGVEGAVPPFVTVDKTSGTPSRSFGGASPLEAQLWNIRATGRGGSGAREAEEVAAEIDAALDGYELSVSGRSTLYLRRDSDLNYSDVEDGVVWHYVGALYRLIIQ